MTSRSMLLSFGAVALVGCARLSNAATDARNGDAANDVAATDVAADPGPTTDDVFDARPDGPCVPTVARGNENTDALCSDGIDNDCNGYIDCNDFACSRSPSVTVCPNAGHRSDGGFSRDATAFTFDGCGGGSDGGIVDAAAASVVGPMGGTVDLLHFGVFGDVRPPNMDDTAGYPTVVIESIMDQFNSLGAQFVVASGDYMFATTSTAVTAQTDLLMAAEAHYGGHVFHAMGNHECTGATASNCPLANETPNVQTYRTRLAPAYATPYFDWTVHTSMGDAHFIATAPNAWSTNQQTWLTTALAQPASYTFVLAHEPPSSTGAPGTTAIESSIAARVGGVTLRLYGHTHEYRHLAANATIAGNGGAPLSFGGYFGFLTVDQRNDGNIVVTAYQIGCPSTVSDSFVVTPSGALTH